MNDVDALIDLSRAQRVVVLTGAGCSTESGIPDYRGPQARRRRTPVQFKAFASDPLVRARYWARSSVGWPRVAGARPNRAHGALSALERMGVVTGIITQNVDGLHQRAGSRAVIELHGSLSRVRCLTCRQIESRAGLQRRLHDLNPEYGEWAAAIAPVGAPDGDADLDDGRLDSFRVPACLRCDGILKPDVVFFGENVPRARVDRSWDLYRRADVLWVVGSSLAVFSGFRFVLRAFKDGRPIVIVNQGETRGDRHARIKVEGRVGDVLPLVLERLQERAAATTGAPVAPFPAAGRARRGGD